MFHYALLYTKSVPNSQISFIFLKKIDRGNWWVPPVKEKAY